MDYLQIDDNQVFNHLVDQKSIESVLVCRTQAVAKSLMTHRENVPQNVSYAITLDYYKFNPPRGASSYRSYYMDPIQVHFFNFHFMYNFLKGSGMLRSTLASQVAERGEEVKGLERHLMGLENEKEALLRARSGFEGEKKRAVAKIQQLRTKMTSISSQLTQVHF